MPLITFNIKNKFNDQPKIWIENSWKVTTLIIDIEDCLKESSFINSGDLRFLKSVKDYAKRMKKYSAAQEEHIYKVINRYKNKKVEKNDRLPPFSSFDDEYFGDFLGDED